MAGGAPTFDTRAEAATRLARSDDVSLTRVEPSRRSVALPDLLRDEEASRARGFAGTSALLALFALAVFPFFAQGKAIEPFYVAALLASIGASVWLWWRVRDPRRYGRHVFRIFCVVCLASMILIILYGGPFSPAVVILALGLSFAGMGEDRRFALGICIAGIALHLAACVLILTGVMSDQGLLAFTGADRKVLGFATMMTPVALAIMLWQARLSRRSTRVAVDRLEQAMRLAHDREAQLEEVVHDLRAARQGGAGVDGRYTGWRAGAYVLGAVIGRGGMGEVYAASHVDTESVVAVKVLGILHDEQNVRRFAREGAIAAALIAPNVVRVYEVGAFEDGTQYIVMELLQGTDLASLLVRSRLEHGELIKLVAEIAEGLEAVHIAGVIHRDVKPRNLFRCDRDEGQVWKLLDFGVSRDEGSSGTLTEGEVVGTPGYMSPEQAKSIHTLDCRADVFSFGAVIYRCLTGRPPFGGPSVPQVLFDIVYQQPLQPSRLAPWLPGDVDLVLALMLAKDARERLGGAREASVALQAAFRGKLDPALRIRAHAVLARLPWRPSASPAPLHGAER